MPPPSVYAFPDRFPVRLLSFPCGSESSPTMKRLLQFCAAAALTICSQAQDLAGDLTLHRLLIPGEDWQLVVDKQGFVDAPCAGDDDNFYFSDMRSEQGVFRVRPDGTVEPFVKAKGVSE